MADDDNNYDDDGWLYELMAQYNERRYLSYSICCGISAISVFTLLVAILRHPKVRSNTTGRSCAVVW